MSFPPTVIPAVAIAARRRRIMRKFEDAGADQPTRAVSLEALGLEPSHLLTRMMRSGVLVSADGERYYLDAAGIARWRRRRNIYVLVTMGVMASLLAAVFWMLNR